VDNIPEDFDGDGVLTVDHLGPQGGPGAYNPDTVDYTVDKTPEPVHILGIWHQSPGSPFSGPGTY
jgi:hypothetical protein